MTRSSLAAKRNWAAVGLGAVVVAGLAWHFSPGLPVLFGPSASASTKKLGHELFVKEWAVNDPLAHGDGLGPVFNDRSCVACHNQGGVGGGGDNSHNVTNFHVVPGGANMEFIDGTVHANAASPQFMESFELVRKKFPVVRGRIEVINHCSVSIPDFDPVSSESIQTTALFGAGWIDRISPKSILANRRTNQVAGALREFKLEFDTIPAGRARILDDGRVGKFGWKGQFATLEEFVAAACGNELGLSTPLADQAKPIHVADYAETKPDLNRKQFRALTAFVDTLPRPVEVLPTDAVLRDQAVLGKTLFTQVGCAICHVPDMGGVKGVYSDFLLHRIFEDNGPGGGSGYNGPAQQVPDAPINRPAPDEWKTPPLWGVADSAPYMHDGSSATLKDAIHRHGGSARNVRDAFRNLQPDQQAAVIEFLKTLKAPPEAMRQ